MNPEDFKSVIALAFQAAEEPDWDAFYRKVCRWFSQTLSTPIKDVEDYSEEYVLRHYFEHRYVGILESGGEEQEKQWAEARAAILKMHAGETSDDGEEDRFWEQALEEEFAKDNPHLVQNPSQPDPSQESPNLSDEFNINPDDPIPED